MSLRLRASRRSTVRLVLPLAASLLACCSADVRAGRDAVLKTTAVVGSLLPWGLALWRGEPLTDCADRDWRIRLQSGQDRELRLAMLAAAHGTCRLIDLGRWSVVYSPTYSLSRWSTRGNVAFGRAAWDVAAIPLLRWRRPLSEAVAVEIEFGVGMSLLSRSDIGNRRKGSHFQFSDHAGLALADRSGAWRGGWAYRHLSNADLRKPNVGVDFNGLFLEWRL